MVVSMRAGKEVLDDVGDVVVGDGDGVRCGDPLGVLSSERVERGVQRLPPLG
jgi:hypothetical protein